MADTDKPSEYDKLCMDTMGKVPESMITNYSSINPKILVCSKCDHPVKMLFDKCYSCEHCNSITANVKWIDNSCKS